MTVEEQRRETERIVEYNRLEEWKQQVLKSISFLQKEPVTELVFWTKTEACGGYSRASCGTKGIEPYKQFTLDYLNMLYERMCNDQKNL